MRKLSSRGGGLTEALYKDMYLNNAAARVDHSDVHSSLVKFLAVGKITVGQLILGKTPRS